MLSNSSHAFHCFFVFSSKKLSWRGFYPESSYVISLCCVFSSQGTLLYFAAVKIVKTSKETRNFFRADFFACFSCLCKFSPEI